MKTKTSSKIGGNASEAKYCQKFNDATSLERAYLELEKDYTRKCQELASYRRLSERTIEEGKRPADLKSIITDKLNSETNHLVADDIPEESAKSNPECAENTEKSDENVESNENSVAFEGVEKVEKGNEKVENGRIYDSPDWSERVLDFFIKNPEAKAMSSEIAKILYDDDGIAGLHNGLDVAYMMARNNTLVSKGDILNDSKFIEENVITNDEIKEKVLDSFLGGLIKRNGSLPLYSKKSGGNIVTPSRKIKTLEEARDILLGSIGREK